MPVRGHSRRRRVPLPLLLLAVGAAALLASRSVVAEAISVPAQIQAQLLSKLEGYDKGFGARAGDVARVLLVVKPGSAKSALSAEEMKSALARLDRIGGLPHEETVIRYDGAEALARKCRTERIAIVYFTPGFDDDLASLKVALAGTNVLTLAAVSSHVPLGIALGFELESGRPKIVINLAQARRQGIEFPPSLLQLMKVYR